MAIVIRCDQTSAKLTRAHIFARQKLDSVCSVIGQKTITDQWAWLCAVIKGQTSLQHCQASLFGGTRVRSTFESFIQTRAFIISKFMQKHQISHGGQIVDNLRSPIRQYGHQCRRRSTRSLLQNPKVSEMSDFILIIWTIYRILNSASFGRHSRRCNRQEVRRAIGNTVKKLAEFVWGLFNFWMFFIDYFTSAGRPSTIHRRSSRWRLLCKWPSCDNEPVRSNQSNQSINGLQMSTIRKWSYKAIHGQVFKSGGELLISSMFDWFWLIDHSYLQATFEDLLQTMHDDDSIDDRSSYGWSVVSWPWWSQPCATPLMDLWVLKFFYSPSLPKEGDTLTECIVLHKFLILIQKMGQK